MEEALSRWESVGRAALPVHGLVLERRPGEERQAVTDAVSRRVVHAPVGHVLALSASPDGRWAALQTAPRADEDAGLQLLEVATGRVRDVPGVRCRYEPMRWAEDRLELVARPAPDAPAALLGVRLADACVVTVESVADDARVRLFDAGPDGVLVESRPGEPTVLRDRGSGAVLARRPAVVRVLEDRADHEAVVVLGRHGVTALDAASGSPVWDWADEDLVIADAARDGDRVRIVGAAEGRSVVVEMVAGSERRRRPVLLDGGPAAASAVGADAQGRPAVLAESPLHPPRVVPIADLAAGDALAAGLPAVAAAPVPGAAGPVVAGATRMLTVPADDGAVLTVAVTSPPGATGPRPTIVTCYGGFGVAALPAFEPTVPAWIEHGGCWATAQVRGGGEHGRAFRRAGQGVDKARGVDDLRCIVRGLVAAGLTRPEMLCVIGGSHGGVLAASAALLEAHAGAGPWCAGVVTTAAPVDLERLADHPFGRMWEREFGDPSTAAGRAELRRLNPVRLARQLPPGVVVPAFLGVTLAEDARVRPEPTRALVAALREHGVSAEHHEVAGAGHGGNHLDAVHELGARVLAFSAQVTDASWYSYENHSQ